MIYCIYSKYFRRLDFSYLVLMDLEEKTRELKKIEREVAKCQKCALYKTRQKTVPGEGNPASDIMFVGEAPGAREDIEGRPFCGPAGKFLDQLLDSIGLRRDDVFIANTLKCRPPNNRDPEPAEKELCRMYLEEQIGLNPKNYCYTWSAFNRNFSARNRRYYKVASETIPSIDRKIFFPTLSSRGSTPQWCNASSFG